MIVAAADASDDRKKEADLVCAGVDDRAIIRQAIDMVETVGGWVDFGDGTYQTGELS